MGNESSTEVVQDEAKFLEGLQGMCVSMRYDRSRVRAGSAVICCICCYVSLLWTMVRRGIARFVRSFVHGMICSRIIALFLIHSSLIIRSLDDPDVRAVDEQVNAGTSWAVSYMYV